MSISKWPSEHQVCQKWTYIWQRSSQKQLYNGHLRVTFVSDQSLSHFCFVKTILDWSELFWIGQKNYFHYSRLVSKMFWTTWPNNLVLFFNLSIEEWRANWISFCVLPSEMTDYCQQNQIENQTTTIFLLMPCPSMGPK